MCACSSARLDALCLCSLSLLCPSLPSWTSSRDPQNVPASARTFQLTGGSRVVSLSQAWQRVMSSCCAHGRLAPRPPGAGFVGGRPAMYPPHLVTAGRRAESVLERSHGLSLLPRLPVDVLFGSWVCKTEPGRPPCWALGCPGPHHTPSGFWPGRIADGPLGCVACLPAGVGTKDNCDNSSGFGAGPLSQCRWGLSANANAQVGRREELRSLLAEYGAARNDASIQPVWRY